MQVGATSIVGYRLDLRLSDYQAVLAAVCHGDQMVPVHVHAVEEGNTWAAGSASRWWSHQSLESPDRNLQKVGSRMIIRSGDSAEIPLALIEETGVRCVLINRVSQFAGRVRDLSVVEC